MSASDTKYDNQFNSGNGTNSPSLESSFGCPVDEWDDLDDFETPAKGKNGLVSPGTSGKSGKSASFSSEEEEKLTQTLNQDASLEIVVPEVSSNTADKSSLTGRKQSSGKMDEVAHSVDSASPRHSPIEESAEWELEDSPVKRTQKQPLAQLKYVTSDSEEESVGVSGPLKDSTGE